MAQSQSRIVADVQAGKVITGAEQTERYFTLLRNKRIALCINQTSMIGNTHLVDSMKRAGLNVRIIFAPEHGFRGGADAGEHLNNGIDSSTGIKVISIYGKKLKPSPEDFDSVDYVLFDIQDVGARFYTYVSTLHYLMEACADAKLPLMVLDRPNPNGHYVDGFVLDKKFQSFVGIDPIPIVHGLTVAEYARMANGEGWLENHKKCELTYVNCVNYDHTTRYSLPVKPSPNLPNDLAVQLYPSLCFFEGTEISLGRGTSAPFQMIGSPNSANTVDTFTPRSLPGAKSPPQMGQLCKGFDLRQRSSSARFGVQANAINFSYVLQMYKDYSPTSSFFLKTNFIDKLAGTDQLRLMMLAGKTEADIRAAYAAPLAAYKAARKKYLLYKDFE